MPEERTKAEIKAKDRQYEENTIMSVDHHEGSYSITMDSGWSLFIEKDTPIIPEAGHVIRLYGRGIGYSIRGVDIDGVEVRYSTPQEEEDEKKALNDKWIKEQEAEEVRSKEAYAARLAENPHAFDWDRAGPGPEAAFALNSLLVSGKSRAQIESEFPATYSGQAWRYAYRLWIATDADWDALDNIGPYEDVPGVESKDLDLTGFMVGWAMNAVRQMRHKEPKENGAVVTIGAEQSATRAMGSANEDLQKVMG